jgi:hypothetical protein
MNHDNIKLSKDAEIVFYYLKRIIITVVHLITSYIVLFKVKEMISQLNRIILYNKHFKKVKTAKYTVKF